MRDQILPKTYLTLTCRNQKENRFNKTMNEHHNPNAIGQTPNLKVSAAPSVVNSMLTVLAQSFLPSSTNQQQQQQQQQKTLSNSDTGNLDNSSSHHRNECQSNHPHISQAKRRATHNAVERRRRDRINQHIQQLSKLIPDCSNFVKNQSKTAVLEKTIAYLQELKAQNLALAKQTVDAGIILHENDVLRDRIRSVEQENGILKSLLAKRNHIENDESSP